MARPNAWDKRLSLVAQDDGAQQGRDSREDGPLQGHQDARARSTAQQQPKRKAQRGKASPVVFNLLDSLAASGGRRADPPPPRRVAPKPAPPKQHVASRASKPKRPTAIKRAVLQRRQQV